MKKLFTGCRIVRISHDEGLLQTSLLDRHRVFHWNSSRESTPAMKDHAFTDDYFGDLHRLREGVVSHEYL